MNQYLSLYTFLLVETSLENPDQYTSYFCPSPSFFFPFPFRNTHCFISLCIEMHWHSRVLISLVSLSLPPLFLSFSPFPLELPYSSRLPSSVPSSQICSHENSSDISATDTCYPYSSYLYTCLIPHHQILSCLPCGITSLHKSPQPSQESPVHRIEEMSAKWKLEIQLQRHILNTVPYAHHVKDKRK